MSLDPEALERLREKRDRCDKFRAASIDVEAADLRDLLDAYEQLRAQADRQVALLESVADFLEPDACADCSCEGANSACGMLDMVEQAVDEAKARRG